MGILRPMALILEVAASGAIGDFQASGKTWLSLSRF